MEPELFSASPRAAQMARARLRLALGAFGSSYSSLLATVHLSLSAPSPLVVESRISAGRERLPHIFTLHKVVFRFNALTSVSHFSGIQMYSTAQRVSVSFSALCSTVMQINLFYL